MLPSTTLVTARLGIAQGIDARDAGHRPRALSSFYLCKYNMCARGPGPVRLRPLRADNVFRGSIFQTGISKRRECFGAAVIESRRTGGSPRRANGAYHRGAGIPRRPRRVPEPLTTLVAHREECPENMEPGAPDGRHIQQSAEAAWAMAWHLTSACAPIVAVIRPVGRGGFKVARAASMPGIPMGAESARNIGTYFQRWPRARSLYIAGWNMQPGHGQKGSLGHALRPAPLASSSSAHVRKVYVAGPFAGGEPSNAHGQDFSVNAHVPPVTTEPIASGKTTLRHIARKYKSCTPISVVTAYDFPSAQLAERAGVDVVLMGDSVGMVVLGYDSTTSVTMEEMLHHCKAVRRGAQNAFVVADLPFGSYLDPSQALTNAARLLKEGGADAVKLEGGRRVLPQVEALTAAGIAVMGHIGLTPQTHAALGGYVVQGKTAKAARDLIEDSLALERAGCWGIVLEMVPQELAAKITVRLSIPTIGIGAGVHTSGQVQVMHDLLGMYSKFHPRFAGRYAAVGAITERALSEYVAEVVQRRFPTPSHSFSMPESELEKLEEVASPVAHVGETALANCE